MPALGVFIGLLLGLIAGGKLDNLTYVRLRWLPVLLIAVAARFGLDAALSAGAVPDELRLWLVLAAYILLTAMLVANRSLPGMAAAAFGTVANGIAIVVNGGWMPVWPRPDSTRTRSTRISTGCSWGRWMPPSSPTAVHWSTSFPSRYPWFNRLLRSAT